MKHSLTALTTATILSLSAMSATAMEQEINSLTGAVYNSLNGMQMDLTGIESLTLLDIRKIQTIMGSGDTESEKRSQINNLLRKANNR